RLVVKQRCSRIAWPTQAWRPTPFRSWKSRQFHGLPTREACERRHMWTGKNPRQRRTRATDEEPTTRDSLRRNPTASFVGPGPADDVPRQLDRIARWLRCFPCWVGEAALTNWERARAGCDRLVLLAQPATGTAWATLLFLDWTGPGGVKLCAGRM